MNMVMEKTFTMIKPNAVADSNIGGIINMIEENGFLITDIKMLKLTETQARAFYKEHEGKSWFENLITFMISDSIVAMVLEKENAIKDYRKLIGSTENSEKGTIREKFGENSTKNAVHGSDSLKSSIKEVNFFFNSDI